MMHLLCLPFCISRCQYAHIYHNDTGGNGIRESVFMHLLTLANVCMPTIFNTLNHDDWPITAQANEDDMD